MKKLFKIALRVLCVLVALAVIALLASLEGVDYQPYFRQPYYRETVARLREQAKTNTVVEGPLSAGFGRARLTPTVNAPADDPAHGAFRSVALAGYGNRHGKPSQGTHDDLYIKALALKTGDRVVVMFGADTLIIPYEVTGLAAARIEKELGLSREQLYLSATHTHCSLGGWGEGMVAESFAGPFQPGAREWFAECIVAAARAAVGDLKPARFGQGSFSAPTFIRNRVVGELGRVDPEFVFALVKQDDGRQAVLGVFGAHATVQSGNMMQFSADWPGCWEAAVEQATGGQAMFLAGGVGSHSPAAGGGDFAAAERFGQTLARQVVDHLAQTPLTNRLKLGLLGLEVALPPLGPRISDGLRLRPWLARKLLHPHERAYLQALRLDDTIWVSTPCDFSGELALDFKDFLRSRGYHAVVTSFNGDYIGYVIPHRYYHLDGYEPRLMSFFGPCVPDYLMELMETMASSLIRN